MRLARLRFRMLSPVLVVVVVSVGIVAIATAGPSAKSAHAQAVTCVPGTTVRTSDGQVCGITSTAARGVKEWRGIPYAAPPVGNLRWQPPQPPRRWTGTLRTTTFGSACTQTSGAGSEDC